MRRTFTQGLAVAAVAVTVVSGVAGCGVVNQLSAKQKVSKAMSSFSDAKSATFTMSLDTTSQDIQKISAANDEELTADDLAAFDKLLKGDVVYSLEAADGQKLGATKPSSASTTDLQSLLKDPAKLKDAIKKSGSVSMAVRLDGGSLVELRVVKGVMYARADVPKIVDLAEEDPAVVDDALADLPAGLEPLRKAAKGEWISLNLTAAVQVLSDEGIFDELQTSLPDASTTPTVDPASINKLLTDLKAAYEDKVTITELGDSDRGDKFRLTASAKQVAGAVQDDIIKIVGDAGADDIKSGIADLSDKPINLDVWVKDDKLTGVALDLTQFLDTPVPGTKLALDMDVKVDSGPISAPTGATPLDIRPLIEEASSAFSAATGGSSMGSGFDDSFDDTSIDGLDSSLEDSLNAVLSGRL